VVELVKPEDVLGKMVYAIAKPGHEPLGCKGSSLARCGILTAIDHNVPLTATKPIRFFDPENGDLPDVIDLHFRRAPGFERLSHVEYSKLLRDKVAEAKRKASCRAPGERHQAPRRRGVLNQHWNSVGHARASPWALATRGMQEYLGSRRGSSAQSGLHRPLPRSPR